MRDTQVSSCAPRGIYPAIYTKSWASNNIEGMFHWGPKSSGLTDLVRRCL